MINFKTLLLSTLIFGLGACNAQTQQATPPAPVFNVAAMDDLLSGAVERYGLPGLFHDKACDLGSDYGLDGRRKA